MPFTPERSTINQRIQIGAESTSALGTSVAATKLIECFDWQLGIEAEVNFYTPTGRKYPSTQEENEEWTSGTLGGNMDYNGIIYPLASIVGSVAPVAHLASATAKDWIFIPPVTGSIVPQAYTIEQGDTVRAHKLSYGLFTQWGYKGTRKDFTTSGKLIGQLLADGITMTASPTAIVLAPMVSKHFNVYLDPTSAALGTTLLTRVLSLEYNMENVYGPAWFLNRATPSWTAHVDMKPKATLKLKLEADSTGMSILPTYVQAGATAYVRLQALGNQIASDGPGTINNTFQHDMAVKMGKPSNFEDQDGIFAIEWECTVVEDPAWGTAGQSQKITVTSLIGAL